MSWRRRFSGPGSALCVGLDPRPDRLPPGVGVLDFCMEVVDLTREWAACYKANAAFFERLGPAGMDAYAALLSGVRARGVPVIADVKRGDVPSTAEAYAEAYFGGPFDADAVTANASLGRDAVEPFLRAARAHDRGVFVLLRTSNPGAARFQQALEAPLVEMLRDEPRFGAVVGATDSETGARLRRALPETLFLVPGFGAQGGRDLHAFFDGAGEGAVVASSRAILYPDAAGDDWKAAIRRAARAAHETVERARKR